MKIYWWQAGLHFEPQTEEEFKALTDLSELFHFTEFGEKVESGPICSANLIDENSVLGVHILP